MSDIRTAIQEKRLNQLIPPPETLAPSDAATS
jgi:hypothetical protein